MKLALILIALGALTAALIAWFSPAPPRPALIAGLADDGLRAAPCPARTLIEEKSRVAQKAPPMTAFAARLNQLFPPGSPGNRLENRLAREGFAGFTPCANDDSVLGARFLARRWGDPDAFVYWRKDDADRLILIDGHLSATR